ncbi:GNAT family N-acetyltransferase [Aliagarivorans marinus]|uniref:GNAT family N-acetyltransferase n=1 Tax=Aliagarivorans marinus TaxID=561965 RepID=UPI0004042473|nr:GNAT family N-acetyltransferase [Aliagarivorans marinus]
MELTIRRAQYSDVSAIKAIYAQAHAYEATLQLPYPSDENWHKRFEASPPEHYNLVAEREGKLVGQLTLETSRRARRKHVATFGMAVCSSALKQGVGSALLSAAIDMCDNWLNIQRIEVECYSDNQAAIALYTKLGFEVEGEHKNYAFKNGRFADVLSMARLIV